MQKLDLSKERILELWGMHPFVKTAPLASAPADISAVLNCR